MEKDEPIRFCLITCLLKRLVKYLLEVWLCIVEYYLGNYGTLCKVLEFWPRVFWLAVRTRGYTPARIDDCDSEANVYIDELLREKFENDVYCPYEMQDCIKRFDGRIAFVNVWGEAAMFCYVTGLKTLRRINEACMKAENGQLTIKSELGGGVLNFYSSGKVKFMNVGPTFIFRGHIGYLEAHVEFSVDPETGRNGRLKELVIYEMRGVHFEITKLKPLNWVLNQIIALKCFRRFIRNLVEIGVENYIAENIWNFQFLRFLSLVTDVAENHTSASVATESTPGPIVAEGSNEQIAYSSGHDSEGKLETTDKIADTTDIPESNTAGKEAAGEQLAATEQDSEGKAGRSDEETAEATGIPESHSTGKEVAGEPLAATEQDSEGKSGKSVEEATGIPESNTAGKEVAGADDPASLLISELEKSEATLSAPSSSGSDLETTNDTSDLD